jgi:hypothetical protein
LVAFSISPLSIGANELIEGLTNLLHLHEGFHEDAREDLVGNGAWLSARPAGRRR